jgi:small GTP-binding protein
MQTIQRKVCVLGDFAVGKTSLIRRYVEGIFDESYLTTVGVVVSRKTITYADASLNLLLWDLAGGQDFYNPSYLGGLAGAFVVCDLTREATLPTLRAYVRVIGQANERAKVILLANKSDLVEMRVTSDEQLNAISQELGSPLIVTSAKTGDQVESAFRTLADSLIGRST